MKHTESNAIGKTIRVRKLGYELVYKVEEISTLGGTTLLEGTITEASESCPYSINDHYFVSENEVKSANYPVLNNKS